MRDSMIRPALTSALILGFLGCASQEVQAKKKPSKVSAEAFLNACKPACTRSQMAKAVGAQVIDAQCAKSCAADWKLPACDSKNALAKRSGKRARVFGKLAGKAGALALRDGTVVTIKDGPALSGTWLGAAEGRGIVVVGTVQKRKGAYTLEYVTTIASN